jgi:hypothetical protein
LRQRGQDAESTGIGNRRCQFGVTDTLHTALHDGPFDAEELGDSCVEHKKAFRFCGWNLGVMRFIGCRRHGRAAKAHTGGTIDGLVGQSAFGY